MIVVSRGQKDTPYRCLAGTTEREYAYFIPHAPGPKSFMRDEDDDEDEDDYNHPVRSPSGANWLPCIDGTERLTMFIAGNPGAGKSYLAKEMIRLLPDDFNILLFTALEESDGNFKELGKSRLYKIRMDVDNLSSISLSEIRKRSKNTVLLFDDVDKIREKDVSDWVFRIMEDALANGRGHEKHDGNGDIHVICTSHALNDYRKTKYTLENSNYVALFPGSTTRRQLDTLFEKIGLDKSLCTEMLKLGKQGKIRSIIIHKVAPMFIIYGDKIMLI